MYYKEDSLMGTYQKLKEAGSVSDFPQVMADVQHKILLNAFKGFPSVWGKAGRITSVTDFKPHHRKWLSEMTDLKKKTSGGGYQEAQMSDRGYNVQVSTWGELFSLEREVVINDDLDAFRDLPAKMGRAAARTIAKEFVRVIEANELAYDGTALIRSTNSSSTALTADATGVATLQTAIKTIATATDPDSGEIMGLTAKYLMVSPSLAETAAWLLNSTALIGSTSAMQMNPLTNPALSPKLELIIEPMLDRNFPNRWYVLADPSQAHAVEIAFLNGKSEPDLFVEESKAMSVAGGGRDQFGYDFDNIKYKARIDFAAKAAFYQAIYKGGS